MESCQDQTRQDGKREQMGEKKVTGRGGRRNYCKGKGGKAKRKSIPVTPVSPMLVGLPVRVNKIKYPRWLKKVQ